MIVLKGRVLDGNGGAPIEKGAVVLEDNRIRLVCQQSQLPDDPTAEVYELEDGTIMPGLIDAHVHMGWGSATAVDWISMTPQLSMARALRDMAQLRQQGYTAFRDLGSDVLLMRPAVAEGLLDVPRIFGAGRIISQIGGHGDVYQKLSLEASQRAYSPAFIVNGVDEVRPQRSGSHQDHDHRRRVLSGRQGHSPQPFQSGGNSGGCGGGGEHGQLCLHPRTGHTGHQDGPEKRRKVHRAWLLSG